MFYQPKRGSDPDAVEMVTVVSENELTVYVHHVKHYPNGYHHYPIQTPRTYSQCDSNGECTQFTSPELCGKVETIRSEQRWFVMKKSDFLENYRKISGEQAIHLSETYVSEVSFTETHY